MKRLRRKFLTQHRLFVNCRFDPLNREVIFDKYMQLDKKSDGRMYTTGLGLAFCKMAVGAHGGRIGVESGGEKGSRFFFVIQGVKKKLKEKRGA